YEEAFQKEIDSDFAYTKRLARMKLGYEPNLTNPESFNEKLIHRRLFSRDPVWPVVTDKIGVRAWAQQHAYDRYARLPEILGIFESPKEIPSAFYGQPVVIKAAWA